MAVHCWLADWSGTAERSPRSFGASFQTARHIQREWCLTLRCRPDALRARLNFDVRPHACTIAFPHMTDKWTKLQAVGTVALPVVVAVIGGAYTWSAKQSENQVRYVELAVAQLRSPPTPESTALREWAVDLLDSQAPVKLSAAARAQLMSTPLAAPVALAAGAKASASTQGNLSVTGK